ncbi:MAG: hypothetical protein ABIN36_05590 [Ferruginibacter sp.]
MKSILLAGSLMIILFGACNKDPVNLDFINVRGTVIAKETCNTNETTDYWLIDLTLNPDTPQYGSTVTINGAIFTDVVKTKELSPQLKELGKHVFFHFQEISDNPVETLNCNVSTPVTYLVKEIYILEQGEAL